MVTPVLSAAVIAVAGDPSTERLAGDALHAWVYVVVYVGFAVQGVGIVTLFGAPGRTRLPWLFARRSAPSSPILVGGVSAGALAGLGLAAGERSQSGLVRSRRVRECRARVLGGHGAAVRGRGAGVSGDDTRLRLFGSCRLARDGAMVCWSGYTLLVASVDAASPRHAAAAHCLAG